MRVLHWVLVVLVMVGVGAAGVRAEEEDDGLSSRRQAYDAAFRLLRIRLEARLEAARVLRDLRRYDEALEMLRGIDGLYEEELARLQQLLDGPPLADVAELVEVVPPAAPEPGGPSPVPFQGPTSNAPCCCLTTAN